MTARAKDDELEVALLERYCSETASSEETTRIEAWFREYPDQRVWYEQLRAGLKKGDFPHMSAEQSEAAQLEIVRAALQRRPASDGKQVNVVQPDWGTADLARQSHAGHSGYRPVTAPQTLRIARQREGIFSMRTLRWFLSTVLNRVAGSAIAALFGRHVTTLTTAEITELQGLVEHAEPEDE